MKRLLLFVCVIPSIINAQNKTDYSELFKQKTSELKNLQGYPLSSVESDSTTKPFDLALFLTNPKPGVHHLPQDNMPCLIPDPTATVSIPNAWAGEIKVPYTGNPPHIPNAAKPFTLSPTRPLLATPDTK